jgi:DNA gyrase subunit A
MREEDEISLLLSSRTLDTLLFFSDKGKVYSMKAHQIPAAGRTDRGVPAINVLALGANERITAVVDVRDFQQARYCMMATAKGRVKRIALKEFADVRPSGLIAITLDSGDELGWARITSGKDDILLVTAGGQALRFKEDAVRAMGRTAGGVTGIGLHEGDQVTSMEVVEPGGSLLVVTSLGFGKQTPLGEYPTRGRATGGITTIDHKSLDKIGPIAAARVVQPNDEITFMSGGGQVIRLKVSQISTSGRSTRGVQLMKMSNGDSLASVARIPAETVE